MVKDITKIKIIFQRASKDPNEAGRIMNSNKLIAKRQLGGVKKTTKPTVTNEFTEVLKTSKILLFQKREPCQKA